MHTILGAGGAVANALTKQLIQHGETVRLISRRPVDCGAPTVSWLQGDLLNADRMLEVTRGSTVIYLCAGLKYDSQVWKEQWPVIMRNVIAAASRNDARLIFFDNVYMYGLVDGEMTEETPYRPVSEKGEVRAKLADHLMEEVQAGRLRASIARAPDFYGIHNANSFLDSMVINRAAAGQRAMWIGDQQKLHNFLYIPDAGRAVYLLGQQPESDNQIWHLPTAPAISGKEMLSLVSEVYGAEVKSMSIKKWMLRLLGAFDPVVKGSVEMYYQYDHDYRFNSDKFERAFGMSPTPYRQGLLAIREQEITPETSGRAVSQPG